MKTLKTIALISIVSVGMTSSVFASWWNPTSWKIFKRESGVANQERKGVVNVSTTTFNELTKDSFTFCNGSKYKKCPEGQSFVCPTNGEDAYCEKGKSDEIKTPKTKDIGSSVLTNKAVTKTVTTKVETPLKVTTQTENENFNITILSVIESLIRNYENYTGLFKEFNTILLEREQRSTEIKNALDKALLPASEYNTNYNNSISLLLKARTEEIAYLRAIRASNEQNISNLENSISLMKQYKAQKENMFYLRMDAVKEAKELMPLYDKLDPYMDAFSKFKDGYFEYTGKNDDLYSSTITALQNQNTTDYNYISAQRRTITQSAPASQITIPKIDLPKMPTTTYCESRYTGIHGNYNITCVER